ncbi:hypothetical protein J416_00464 [Gracilibacillus halophilus YIM-C55.5]|uniref:DUF58 domain-containing protein n=1 Tax=Gracilibacillus halophilus YIM-C55.5 TaxID=1308866 RepID=N4WGN4_9BACI|nr:DUF58 domain-containing protein [Gracilibacillus halophilus]ENH98414.1 hypothetical protein J416_00464 [Gracilibacillus halophilus YIM-C55.5]
MNIAWVIVVLLVVIFLQGMVYSKWGLRGIRYQRHFKQTTAFEGETIEMVDEIENRKWLPVPWIRLESKMSPYLTISSDQTNENKPDVFHRTLFSLMPFQRIRRTHQLVAKRRGYYPLDTVSVTTGDVVGFGETFDSVSASTAVTVYPKVISMDDIPLPSHSWFGDITVRRWIIEDPFLQKGVREYQYGDPLQAVNWKATARTNQLQINQKDFTADHHVMIYVNFDLNEDIRLPIHDEQVIEKALSYAASLANTTIEEGMATGFGCNGYFVEPFTNKTAPIKPSVRVEPSQSGQQIEYIFDAIAKLTMDRSRNFRAFLQEEIDLERTNTDIVIFTAIMTEKIEHQIQQLKAMGNAVEVVMLDQVQTEAGEADAS